MNQMFKAYDEYVKIAVRKFSRIFPDIEPGLIWDAMEWNAVAGVYPPKVKSADIQEYFDVMGIA